MGLPLSPSCANIFMCFKEKLWLDQCPNEVAPVLFYKRYIIIIIIIITITYIWQNSTVQYT